MILKTAREIRKPEHPKPDLGLLCYWLKKTLALDGNKPDYIRRGKISNSN